MAYILIYSGGQLAERVEVSGSVNVVSGPFTDVFYSSNWIPVPGNTSFSDLEVPGTITKTGENADGTVLYLSNGWTPTYTSRGSVSFRYYCLVKITGADNTTIYRKELGCPVGYVIADGTNCPDGYLECKTDKYPGFCCIPCGEIKAEIQGARQALRGI